MLVKFEIYLRYNNKQVDTLYIYKKNKIIDWTPAQTALPCWWHHIDRFIRFGNQKIALFRVKTIKIIFSDKPKQVFHETINYHGKIMKTKSECGIRISRFPRRLFVFLPVWLDEILDRFLCCLTLFLGVTN